MFYSILFSNKKSIGSIPTLYNVLYLLLYSLISVLTY
nr:MAG TPA: hypothetical protein [Caudoviricetes sp.]